MNEDPISPEEMNRIFIEMQESLQAVTAPLITSKWMSHPEMGVKFDAILAHTLKHLEENEIPELAREIQKMRVLLRAIAAFNGVLVDAIRAEQAQKVSRTASKA